MEHQSGEDDGLLAGGGAAADVSDEALIARIAGGDRSAFDALYDRYAGRIRGVMMKAGAALDEAEETAQEAMLSIWRRADTFDPARAAAPTWIFAIARNRRIDLIRRRTRPEPDPHDPLFHPDPPESSETLAAAAARDAALREAVAGLSREQREAVWLSFFAGLSHTEISERTGAPVGTIKSRLRLAGDRLRATLGDAFMEELLND